MAHHLPYFITTLSPRDFIGRPRHKAKPKVEATARDLGIARGVALALLENPQTEPDTVIRLWDRTDPTSPVWEGTKK